MKNISEKTILLCCAIFMFCTCGNKNQLENYSASGNEKLVYPLKILHSKTHCFLTDYYPATDYADSIISTNKNVTITQPTNGYKEFDIKTDTSESYIAELKVWKNGKYLSILICAGKNNNEGTIYTERAEKNKIFFRHTKKPETVVAMWQNIVLPNNFVKINKNNFAVEIPNDAKNMQRSYIRVFACNKNTLFNDALVPLEKGKIITNSTKLTRHDAHTQIMYSLMIDRFCNGNPTNDKKLNSPEVLDKVDYQGGDLEGITKKINEGFFVKLGISTIWISPITQNPYDAWGQYDDPKTKFSGYHGYWPIYLTKIDDRFGTEEELRELLSAAHAKNINVILDYVSNHMHINSPTLKRHPDWITDSITPDGRRNFELWDEFRLTTWFDKHIPSLDLEREEIYQQLTDSALFWIQKFDFDGFRHDACKHIPEIFWRTLTKKIRKQYPEREIYQIGETYGSPELINSYVKSGMLDAQFDFNVYDCIVDNLIRENGSFKNVNNAIIKSLDMYGYHNLMGYITGNHDRPRFISLASGAVSQNEDTKKAGWKRKIGVGNENAYDKLSILHAILFTIPGVPCIYQGDEYGVPGANDPDNRRMMQFENYTQKEIKTLKNEEKLAQLRHKTMPLLHGEYVPLYADDQMLVFARIYMNQTALVAINKSEKEKLISINFNMPTKIICNKYLSNKTSFMVINNKKAHIKQEPLSFAIYLLK